MTKIFILLGLFVAGTMLGGCWKPRDPSESNLPWARPAAWEGSGPAMQF